MKNSAIASASSVPGIHLGASPLHIAQKTKDLVHYGSNAAGTSHAYLYGATLSTQGFTVEQTAEQINSLQQRYLISGWDLAGENVFLRFENGSSFSNRTGIPPDQSAKHELDIYEIMKTSKEFPWSTFSLLNEGSDKLFEIRVPAAWSTL